MADRSSDNKASGQQTAREGEFDLIADLFAPLAAGQEGTFGLTDDAASLRPKPGLELVLTVDAIIEGVHYLPDDAPETVAAKLLRVNLSDLAAKGAAPLGYLLTAILSSRTDRAYLERFCQGLAADQRHYKIVLLGGDTVSTPGPAGFSLTAIGEAPSGTMRLRSTALPGDLVCVTGTLGDGALGLLSAQRTLPVDVPGLGDTGRAFLAERYRLPQPRVDLGIGLRDVASAGVDISDGLLADLGHILKASNVGARIERAKLPLSDPAKALVAKDPGLWDQIVSGGDDYELLLAVPPERLRQARAVARDKETELTVIGEFTDPSSGSVLVDEAGKVLETVRQGFTHR